MGLTSDKVLALAVSAAVLLFVGTVWLWPRLARRSWRAVGGRVGLLFATQAALFAAVGLAANQAFGFYASWADLFGQEDGRGVVVDHAAGGPSGPLRVVDTRRVPAVAGGRPEAVGRIQEIELVGRRTRIATPAYVYLPPEYFRFPHRTFPAAVVLTGYPGTAAALVDKLRYPRTALELAQAGRMRPMILVMLRPTVAPPRDTECVDVPGGPRTETFFAEDLPEAVGDHYRVGEGRAAGASSAIRRAATARSSSPCTTPTCSRPGRGCPPTTTRRSTRPPAISFTATRNCAIAPTCGGTSNTGRRRTLHCSSPAAGPVRRTTGTRCGSSSG